MNPAEYVTPEDTLQLEGGVWWVHTLSRRKGIAGSSWARNPACTLMTLLMDHMPLVQAMWESPIVPLLQLWKRCHEVWPGSCPCLWKSPLCYPNDVFGIVLVSSPPLTTGGCLEDHQLWGLVVSPKSSALSGARPQPIW